MSTPRCRELVTKMIFTFQSFLLQLKSNISIPYTVFILYLFYLDATVMRRNCKYGQNTLTNVSETALRANLAWHRQ